ncbi:MAG: hypothetical protein ACOH2F_07315 [Cellulomonas sp.]
MNDNTSPTGPTGPSDPIFDRLRAADPAHGVEPDLAALDRAVRARTADPADELAAARSRRGWGTWWPVAAVAASALLFGTAGFAVGSGNGGSEVASNTAAGAIALGQSGSTGVTAPERATGSADSKLSSSMVAPWYGGRTVFTATNLPREAGQAEAWTFDPTAVFTAQTAERVAQALGLAGSAVLTDGAWTVGPIDGSGAALQLQPDGLASISFNDPALDPYSCAKGQLQGAEPGSGGTGATGTGAAIAPDAMPLPEPPQTCTNSGSDAPQGDAAVAQARDVLSRIGLDPSAFEFEAADSGIAQSAYVTAFQVLAGQRTGVTWSISLVGDGVQSVYGSMAPLVSLGTYDIVSATDAAARLADPRFGASYGGPIMYATDKGAVADSPATALGGSARTDGATTTVAPEIAPAPQRTVPPTAQPGSPISWPVTEVALTSSRLGLTMYTQPDGSTVLLPAYELSSDDGQVWSAVAVVEAQLDFAPVG